MDCPVDLLIQRDVKGLYKKALAGEIPRFSGISDPYEVPLAPAVTIRSGQETVEEGVQKIWTALENMGLIAFEKPLV
jgi:adenylylsulfate kinase-like enzyme